MKISQTVFNLQSKLEYLVEMAMFNVQRIITPKVYKSELRFMCSARRLIVLYICVNCREISRTVSELWSGHEYMVEMAIFNIYDVQKAVTQKVG